MMMTFYRLVPGFLLILIAQALLSGCSQPPNYAPVTANNQPPVSHNEALIQEQNKALVSDKKEPVKENRMVIQKDKANTDSLGKYHVVKNGDTLYSIGISSGYGYERLAQWNQISPPYRVVPGRQIKLFKPASGDNIAIKNDISSVARTENNLLKKPIIPISTRKNSVDKPVLSKQAPEISVAKLAIKQEKKSIISTDNKKMLKLNFAWPIKGRISRNFNQSSNKGIDIAGKMGQKVQAAEAGTIAYSGQGLIGFGNLIIIKHNDLYLSAYGNNSRLLVKEGEQVEKGQAIAQVGKALSKKAALHFEIRKNGKPVNPLKFLPKSDKTL